jgi:hypothetical protein
MKSSAQAAKDAGRERPRPQGRKAAKEARPRRKPPEDNCAQHAEMQKNSASASSPMKQNNPVKTKTSTTPAPAADATKSSEAPKAAAAK